MILLLLKSEADCLATQQWQERRYEQQPTLRGAPTARAV
jgi:hypothetical protein